MTFETFWRDVQHGPTDEQSFAAAVYAEVRQGAIRDCRAIVQSALPPGEARAAIEGDLDRLHMEASCGGSRLGDLPPETAASVRQVVESEIGAGWEALRQLEQRLRRLQAAAAALARDADRA